MGNSIRFDKIFHTHKKKSKYFWLHKIICQNSDFKWSEVSKIYIQTEAWYYQHICFYKILPRITRSDLKILSYFNFSLFFGDLFLNVFGIKQIHGRVLITELRVRVKQITKTKVFWVYLDLMILVLWQL